MIVASVLTPPGTGAIAVIGIRGPESYSRLRSLFTPSLAGSLPATPVPGIRFGHVGGKQGDEVILVTRADDSFEIHCHGGTVVVEWILGLLRESGVEITRQWPANPELPDPAAWQLLPLAKTVRCASILLDQARGAYRRAVESGDPAMQKLLRQHAVVGAHLTDPWDVVIAGRPNAGKSSLLNAIAGYARSVVSEFPGTTRDAVSLEVALDGWPVRLTDTAGLRDSSDVLENEGITRANARMRSAELILWLADLEAEDPMLGFDTIPEAFRDRTLVVYNKIDGFPGLTFPGPGVSALTGAGIPELIEAITGRLVPDPPQPGDPVPYAPELAALASTAATL